jgi:hypothetical protein
MSDQRPSDRFGVDEGKAPGVGPVGASRPLAGGKPERPEERAAATTNSLAAIGFEAEFAVVINGEQVKPEDVFKSPANIVRAPMMHRQGKSYHLPTGGAIYFDTGVIEIATSMIEIERGCAARAGRQLWESVDYLRGELDAWEHAHGQDVHLHGFSAHYNVSFDLPQHALRPWRTVDRLAVLLAHVIPVPVMLLATNRRSSGIGLRPRGNRIELTVDFTPDPALMIAAGTFIVAVAREVMKWPSYSLRRLKGLEHELPVVRGFHMHKHTTRRGWVARHDSFPENPFTSNVDEVKWVTTGDETLSLREIGRRVVEYFRPSIEQMADQRSLDLIEGVVLGRAPSLLELEDRPPTYESVGRLVRWNRMFPERMLSRSRYEEVIMRAVRGEVLNIGGERLRPTGMRGWGQVVFRCDRDGSRRVLSLDQLLEHLPRWRTQS